MVRGARGRPTRARAGGSGRAGADPASPPCRQRGTASARAPIPRADTCTAIRGARCFRAYRPAIRKTAAATQPPASSLAHAREVGGIVRAAGPFPFRDLRIRTERARAIHDAAGARRREDRVGFRAFVDPLIERAQRVELIGRGAAGAVAHPRYHEEARELLRLLATAHGTLDS